MNNSRFKFRAWHKPQKRMIADFLIDCLGLCFRDNYTSCESQAASVGFEDFINDISSDVIVMQWTGLKDKNSVDIFEGDVVKTEYTNGNDYINAVSYQIGRDYPAFDLDGWDGDSNGLSLCCGSSHWTMQVIGNIYANPELIKEK